MRRSPHAPRVWLNPVAVWELLDRLGISQNELAHRCGFSPGHLSMLMNGKRSPSPRARRRLMEVLGVDDFEVLFIREPPAAAGDSEGRAIVPNASGHCLEC
ncbi:MAG: helix-turn-helix transcriptional regulator [Chloroflexi bacterium]|nr:helix-turn-helix transcriptional regulator [Chloroflexota bacterium]MYE41684.1 helix-turn-helix transcriptional regulator [Chloroflexota bacterium]